MIKNNNISERISQLIENKCNRNKRKFSEKIGFAPQVISNIVSGRKSKPSFDVLNSILSTFDDINSDWLLTGEGSMLSDSKRRTKNLIPLYDDVTTIGGKDVVAEDQPVYESTIKIDAGDWFNGATAAIRHYGDSMKEYQSGCILAIRELQDKTEIIPGRNYVVETDERRITKKISELDENHFNCHSTNNETYPNGEMIHGPIKIRKKSIRRISKVLGAINYEESTGIVNVL